MGQSCSDSWATRVAVMSQLHCCCAQQTRLTKPKQSMADLTDGLLCGSNRRLASLCSLLKGTPNLTSFSQPPSGSNTLFSNPAGVKQLRGMPECPHACAITCVCMCDRMCACVFTCVYVYMYRRMHMHSNPPPQWAVCHPSATGRWDTQTMISNGTHKQG